MRLKDFIVEMQNRFVNTYGAVAAEVIADAMNEANHRGYHTFEWNGVIYKITAVWKDGCLSGDCNPATCYTNWEIHNVD